MSIVQYKYSYNYTNYAVLNTSKTLWLIIYTRRRHRFGEGSDDGADRNSSNEEKDAIMEELNWFKYRRARVLFFLSTTELEIKTHVRTVERKYVNEMEHNQTVAIF